jgi:hypothetical protein
MSSSSGFTGFLGAGAATVTFFGVAASRGGFVVALAAFGLGAAVVVPGAVTGEGGASGEVVDALGVVAAGVVDEAAIRAGSEAAGGTEIPGRDFAWIGTSGVGASEASTSPGCDNSGEGAERAAPVEISSGGD